MTNVAQPGVRRLFRFRLRTLLALPLLFAAAWWWITWPQRTAIRFVLLISTGQIDSAQRMFDAPHSLHELVASSSANKQSVDRPHMHPATWGELLTARGRFTFAAGRNSSGHPSQFVVDRGRVRLNGLTVTYQLRRMPADAVQKVLAQLFDADIVATANVEMNQITVTALETSSSNATTASSVSASKPAVTSNAMPTPEQTQQSVQYVLKQLGEVAGDASRNVLGRDMYMSNESVKQILDELYNSPRSDAPNEQP